MIIKVPRLDSREEEEIRGHLFCCTNAANNEKVNQFLEEGCKYIATNLTTGSSQVIYTIVKEQKHPFSKPKDPAANGVTVTKGTIIHYEAEVKVYVKKPIDYEGNCKFGFNILWQQYFTNIHQKLETVITCPNIFARQDLIGIVKQSKALCYC